MQNSLPSKDNWKAMLPLFLVIFVDVIGLCIVFPILAPLVYSSNAALVPASWSAATHNWVYGILLVLWPIFMFISAPIMGDLSDKIGRKKVILLCLFGEAIAYMLGAAAITLHSLTLMFLSRILAGIFAGSQPIAQAAIADISTPENKTRNMSKIVLASTLGVVLGPLIGGVTAESNLFSWFNFSTPFQIAALFSFANAVLLILTFHETHEVKQHQAIQWMKCLFLFADAFRMAAIRRISWSFMALMLGWSLYFQALTYFLLHCFGYGTGGIGIFYGVIGLAASVTLSYFIKILLRMVKKEVYIFLGGNIAAFVGTLIAAMLLNQSWQYVAAVICAIGVSLGYTVAISLYSNAVSEDKQGWIMGIPASLQGAAFAITALVIGPLSNIGLTASFYGAALFIGASVVLLGGLIRK